MHPDRRSVDPGRLAGPSPLFCDTALAARIERAEVRLITETSTATRRRRGDGRGFVIPIAGGVASFTEDASPFNKVAGLGFDGVPSAGELTKIERAFAARGASVQVELAHLADPAVGALLTGRGYRLVAFENVLGRALDDRAAPAPPAAIVIRTSGSDEYGQWLDVMADASAHPDDQEVPAHDDFPPDVLLGALRDLTAGPGVARYAAVRDGLLVGGASLRMTTDVAQLTGAATAPQHRRHGVQTALLAARIADATAAGCDVAVVTTQPGSKSQQNVQHAGFGLLYTRAILVRDIA
ncbi:GNAT family N-acetyltransferase [Frankia sp. AiPa1]|uniref:GNAT family N-acetyltransferase n=1 Tax=Frankia sp. AiPa1 TaxID=573492 RepID=UPI00202B7BEF|nr:GNAT family N-acetyltransferase [Frankia sp. AiPa1]MCL9760993.1 GNAT family N-acetyltransferase [Frankia sp. AiPa1]